MKRAVPGSKGGALRLAFGQLTTNLLNSQWSYCHQRNTINFSVRNNSQGARCDRRALARRTARLALWFALAPLIVLPIRPRTALAQDYTVDRAASDELNDFLRKNRLPLVGAQVLKTPDGHERLMLYGFVATDFGKRDAEKKALAHLGGGGIVVENRIVVRPEIGKLKAPPNPEATSGAQTRDSGNLSFDRVMDDIQRFGVKSPPGEDELGVP